MKNNTSIVAGEIKTAGKAVKVLLDLIQFEEEGCHIIYCPALDLSGYGRTDEEAQESFRITLTEFFRYTINKGTLEGVLTKLGWTVRTKPRRKMAPPSMAELLSTNRQFRSIFNKQSFKKFAYEFSIPYAS